MEKASWERSRPFAEQPGQRSTTLTVTLPPRQGWGTPWLVPLTHVTRYDLPQAALFWKISALAAAIIVPWLSKP